MTRSPNLLKEDSPDFDAINLSRALARLEQKILSPTPNPRLLHLSFERTKTAANLEYARILLLRLEHSTSNIKTQSKKQAAQAELHQQRKLIKKLNDKLYELGQQDNGDYKDKEDEEDVLGEDQASPPVTPSTTAQPPLPQPLDRQHLDLDSPTTNFSSTIRYRLHQQQASPTSPAQPATPQSSKAPTILEINSTIQANLTTSLVSLAQSLKVQSLAMAASLETEKPLLSQTGESLNKNTDGMAAAEKRMGILRRMSEGKGWWGRMMLYAWIAGLWMVAILLVFVGPKMRF